MANLASVLKEEISRLSRKEARSETDKLKKASAQYRTEIAALKRRIAALEQRIARLDKSVARGPATETDGAAESNVRFSAKGFRSLRQRLGLTAEALGKILGVSAQTIYGWEAENASPRKQHLPAIAALRKMGKKEATVLLEQRTR
ncbi:helix-turn-helix domain-containing protein [Ferrigenium sp. UT5]|uniref:helix-turn-helix domain-containing protein n=1 Tax=Ferrigenium sp. UT5 TaxID=3242105 RepID=UPI00354B20F6